MKIDPNLTFTPGRGFCGSIEDSDNALVAIVHAWGTQTNTAYGLLFTAAPRLLDALAQCLSALEAAQPYTVVSADVSEAVHAARVQAGLALDSVRRSPAEEATS